MPLNYSNYGKYFSILPMFFLGGCGSDVFIAKKVHFNITFSEAITEISFDLDPKYKLDVDQEYFFGALGKLKISPNHELQSTTLTTEIRSDTSTLDSSWPTTEVQNFPNGKKLPSVLRTGKLKQWTLENENLKLSLAYQASPDLVLGSFILSDQFKNLPKNFLATQEFYAANGQTIASISVMGPTKTAQGGLLYLGNFGSNPFEESGGFKILEAREPMRIISKGQGSFSPWVDVRMFLENIAIDLNTFKAF